MIEHTLSAPLSPGELALGRSRTYALLARLFRREADDDVAAYVEGVPALAEAWLRDQSPSARAADYQNLFGFNVFPYQAIFLDSSGLLGGAETERVQAAFQSLGFQSDEEYAADHIAEELALLAFLCAAEADAWRDGVGHAAAQMQRHQAAFLSDHLLRWLGPLAVAVLRIGSPFYAALAELTLAFTADHAAELAIPEPTFTLESTGLDPDDEAVDLRAIVDYLLQTPRSGLYLARADLQRLGRAFDLPRGFGDRQQMFVNLLRAAGTYDAFAALARTLVAEAEETRRRYEQIGQTYTALQPWLAPWQARATASANLLNTISSYE